FPPRSGPRPSPRRLSCLVIRHAWSSVIWRKGYGRGRNPGLGVEPPPVTNPPRRVRSGVAGGVRARRSPVGGDLGKAHWPGLRPRPDRVLAVLGVDSAL